jgi:hypothetical protein
MTWLRKKCTAGIACEEVSIMHAMINQVNADELMQKVQ